MNKQVLFGKEAREKLLQGVKKITDAVRVTMGSSGKCVLIGEAAYIEGFMHQLPSKVSKDGYTVTKHFSLPDLIENRGAMLIKEAAQQTVNEAGDATTCTCVLAEAIISEGIKLVDAGANSQELKKGIDKAVELVIDRLKEISIPVGDDNDKIFNIATVSANNDTAIGRLIADAYKKIGPHGVIDIESSSGLNTEIKLTDGIKVDRGWISPLFVNNRAKETCEFNDCYILLYDKRVNHYTQIQRALEIANQINRPLLIVCEDVDEQGLGFLGMNVIQQRIRACAIKSPDFGDARRDWMEDLALLTGATYISDLRGVNIKEIEPDNLGFANKVIVSKNETVIIGGAGHPAKVEDFVNDLKMNLVQANTEDEKYPIEKRIARLTGGIAVIQVGAATETELKEKLDRFDDAVRATKAAISEGFIAGGGVAFIRIAQYLWLTQQVPLPMYLGDNKIKNDFVSGMNLLLEILSKPFKLMIENVGLDFEADYRTVLAEQGNIGFNMQNGMLGDLIEEGIIDSTKALRCALQNAASIAGMLLTSECLIESSY